MMEPSYFYRGDTGCYLDELYNITSLVIKHATKNFLTNEETDPLISVYIVYEAYNDKNGEGKLLEHFYHTIFEKKPLRLVNVGEYLPEQVVQNLLDLHESCNISHISAIDFVIE